ncbi:MAG TPA: cation:proton antiporter, partial [Thermoanaerobaculia bacterium]|nr:cation:proton antiporter [Thermoanaerobaculia bacterium]
EEIERQVHDIAHFFVPIFFIAVGAAIDVHTFTPRFVAIGAGLAAIAIVGKILAGICTPVRGIRRAIVGAGMIPRGEVSLIFAQLGLTSGLLSHGLYSSVAIMVVITCVVTPLLLRALLPRGMPAAERETSNLVMDAPMDDERPPARP